MKLLETGAKFCAVLAGVLLTVITLMTCVSLIGRNTAGWTIVGDFELSGSAAGAAIALFMPWCQVKRGNIMVDFFTAKASAATQAKLDRFGALLLALAMGLMTCVSLIGRNTTGWTIVGDIELSASAAGAAVALFLPWCQLRRGNIMIDFFTAKASAATQDRLDRLGAFLLALAMALMTWRTTAGGLSAWTSHSGSMMLGFPDWVVYAFMVPALALTALIAFTQAIRGFDGFNVESAA